MLSTVPTYNTKMPSDGSLGVCVCVWGATPMILSLSSSDNTTPDHMGCRLWRHVTVGDDPSGVEMSRRRAIG